jgi:mono/diheme cytochrome c family protein
MGGIMNGMRLSVSVIVAMLMIVSAAPAQVNYATQIQPIFNFNCVGCHGGTNGVTLSSYAEAMASVGDQYGINVIQPGSSATSPIVDKISNAQPQHGLRMPRGGTPLTTAQITLIKNWIDEGAKPDLIASAPHKVAGTPLRFALSQNFPNPFNPATKIEFSIPERQIVTLKIYDVIGHLVATLVNGLYEAGTYNVEWNASQVASGMYFYQIQAYDPTGATGKMFVETKKLIVQK